MLAALLLPSSAALVPPPPAPPATCNQVSGLTLPDGSPDACTFECLATPLIRFHLEPLRAAETQGYLRATDAEEKSYFFGACGAVSGVTCEGSRIATPAAAVQAWGGAPPTLPSGSVSWLLESPPYVSTTSSL